MNKNNFFVEHPFITLIMVATVCETCVKIVKVLKGNKGLTCPNITINAGKNDKKDDTVIEAEVKEEEKKEE